jgi:hypothetical protein
MLLCDDASIQTPLILNAAAMLLSRSQPYFLSGFHFLYSAFSGLSVDELKSRYVKHCLALPTYGTTCRLVRETSAGSNLYDHELLLGIHHDALISMHPATKDVITRTPMLEMAAFTAKNRFLQCQFANGRTREV